MSLNLQTDEYIRMRGALQEIACGRKVSISGQSQRICRNELQEIARVVCHQFGWTYAPAEIARQHEHAEAT